MISYVYIENYGCTANLNNAEILKGILKQSGYELTEKDQIAEIIIVNTCIVKGKTESKIKRRIQDLSKEYPYKKIIVSGCMPETDADSLKKINPRIILLGIHNIKKINRLLNEIQKNDFDSKSQKEFLINYNEEKLALPKIPANKLISIAQISEGCLGECSYCKTRLAKGKLFSYEEERIVKSIESDLRSGAKEVWLTSQDCASFGLDNGKLALPDLLEKILDLNHRFRLRIGMMNPNNLYPILNKMIEIYKNEKVYKFLHIPIQSASDNILKDMKRLYSTKLVYDLIEKFNKEIPDLTLATDIITGYPNETEEDHKKNLEFIKDFKPDVLNLSKFSSHKKTPAGKLIPLNKEIMNKRAKELMDLHRETTKQNKEKFMGKNTKVFVNTKTKIPGVFESRDKSYNIVLIKSNDKSILGKILDVNITQIGVHHMFGQV